MTDGWSKKPADEKTAPARQLGGFRSCAFAHRYVLGSSARHRKSGAGRDEPELCEVIVQCRLGER